MNNDKLFMPDVDRHDQFLNCSGLETNNDLTSILYHIPHGLTNLPKSCIVPLHYNYDYVNSMPKDFYQYDHQLF